MSDAIPDNRKSRGRGRPRVDSTLVGLRLPPDMLEALDKFVDRDAIPSRPEAVRLILKDWLIANGMLPKP
jgi:hypothetical protein